MTSPTPETLRASHPPETLSRSVIVAYCVPMVSVGFMAMPFYVWLMKYSTDVLLIAPAAFGSLFFVGRLWDAISDPLAGYLSDRTQSPLGRRRSWMLASAIPIAITTVMLWSPPSMLEGLSLVFWMAAALLLYETASTAFFVPYGALGMELTQDYDERTRLFGYRHVIAAAGTIFGLGAVYLLRTAENPRAVAFAISSVAGIAMAATILYSVHTLPEREDYRGRGATSAFKAFFDVLRNPHGRLLFLVYGIETLGAASIGLLAPYVMQYVVDTPDLIEVFIMIYFVPQFAFTPMWIWLGKHYSKKSLWLFSMMVSTAGYFSIFFLRDSSLWLLFCVIFLLGLGGGCGSVIAPSIQADVIDYDEYMTGERKEGAYTAVWNFIRKAAAGVTAFATGLVLQFSGYVPNADDQTEAVKTAIVALMGLFPAACYALGTLFFWRFSLNRKEHQRIIEVLRTRSADHDTDEVAP